MVRQQQFNHRLVAVEPATNLGCCWNDWARFDAQTSRRVSCRTRSVADEGMKCEIPMLMTTHDRVRTVQSLNHCEQSGHLVRYRQGTAPHIDRKFTGTTLLVETHFEQESFRVFMSMCLLTKATWPWLQPSRTNGGWSLKLRPPSECPKS